MLARISEDYRKANTRQKIKLGGLVIKAGLGDENEAVILGALCLAKNALDGSAEISQRERFQAAGDAAFGARHEAN